MLIWNSLSPNWIDYCSHFSDPEQRGMNRLRISLRESEAGGGTVSPFALSPCLAKYLFSLWYIEVDERSLGGARKVTFSLTVREVTH